MSSVSQWPSTHVRAVAAVARDLVPRIAAVGDEADHGPALATGKTGSGQSIVLYNLSLNTAFLGKFFFFFCNGSFTWPTSLFFHMCNFGVEVNVIKQERSMK